MTRITLAHPTNPSRTVSATRQNAAKYLAGGWTVVFPETDESDLDRIFNLAETGSATQSWIEAQGHQTRVEGSVGAVLEWVDEDPLRAETALAAELSSPQPRVTLTRKLEQIATGDTHNTPFGEEE